VLRAMASVADFHEQQKLETLFVIMNWEINYRLEKTFHAQIAIIFWH
jgi:hypothetical protein